MNVEYKHTEIAVKKKLGQNFLTDRNITRKILSLSGVTPGDNILEIGPGFGSLTRDIITVCPRFTVVEKDCRLAEFIETEYPALRVINGDFLETDLSQLATEQPLRILGNIPYSITTPILFRLLDYRRSVSSATLMMQHEVALRITASPSTREYGILAVQMQAFFSVTYLFKVGRKVFKPQPGVDSAVIQLIPKEQDPTEEPEAFRHFIRTAFKQRRKTLHNNLKNDYRLDAVPPGQLQLRADVLSVQELVTLYRSVIPLT